MRQPAAAKSQLWTPIANFSFLPAFHTSGATHLCDGGPKVKFKAAFAQGKAARHSESTNSDRMIDDPFLLRIPVKPFATPIGLRGHDANDRVREAMVYRRIWLNASLHRLKPIDHMAQVIIVRTKRIGRRSAGNTQDFFAVFLGPDEGEFRVNRS